MKDVLVRPWLVKEGKQRKRQEVSGGMAPGLQFWVKATFSPVGSWGGAFLEEGRASAKALRWE